MLLPAAKRFHIGGLAPVAFALLARPPSDDRRPYAPGGVSSRAAFL
jgi:hypothetical protein